ncbi:MAG: YtpR family tRNA-binding protein [Leuconostoc pseudomesenteroides]|uniref:YtpR family tRNA-binding protein n=1 Tax=Leuconostoc pseudomesenteroides TaxID=33968 RepID=UPI0039EB48B3
MITTYNPEHLGDVLMIILAPNANQQVVTTNENVTRVSDLSSDKATGYNIFGIGEKLQIKHKSGQLTLTQEQIDVINQELKQAGFSDELTVEPTKLVIGYVETVATHPDSDHLHVTETRVANDKTLQIVSGSPNIKENIKVAVAQPGTMMPSGALIWDGELRGVPSAGMIVSGRELHLPGAPDKPGALILPDDFGEVGDSFNFEKAANLYRDNLVDINY